MKQILLSIFLFAFCLSANAQTNILVTSNEADRVLRGNFSPDDYAASTIVDHPQTIIEQIHSEINTDSIRAYLEILSAFGNRNTGSDTVSTTRGFGAARRWALKKFQEFSSQNENRLIPSYLQFDQDICGMGQHRNVFGILPGTNVDDHQVLVIEAHMDSRCEENCDIDCLAEGVEDNGSGTALVLELSRIMSKYSFQNTIVFLLTTGEEQGLLGADAFAEYCETESIPMRAVFNNDVVGGIICGETSSAPSCPGFNHIDSTQVRLFSRGGISKHKGLVRWIKCQYLEELSPIVKVPMLLTLMSAEDRTGRGGDHIPFGRRDMRAMRFCSANEHGNADAADPDYHDRQHSIRDILGVDTNADGLIDSFFVDLNYLARNSVINATSLVAAAQNVQMPTMELEQNGLSVTIRVRDDFGYDRYKVGIRSMSLDFDTLHFLEKDEELTVTLERGFHYFSAASIDSNDIESFFTDEVRLILISTGTAAELDFEKPSSWVDLHQNRPNPFDEATYIQYDVRKEFSYKESKLVIREINGKVLEEFEAPLGLGTHEILYTHGYNFTTPLIYSLEVDGQIIAQNRMIFVY